MRWARDQYIWVMMYDVTYLMDTMLKSLCIWDEESVCMGHVVWCECTILAAWSLLSSSREDVMRYGRWWRVCVYGMKSLCIWDEESVYMRYGRLISSHLIKSRFHLSRHTSCPIYTGSSSSGLPNESRQISCPIYTGSSSSCLALNDHHFVYH